jgi:hypothetical protein
MAHEWSALLDCQFAALATRRPAPSVAFTAFAVSCPMPRIVFAQEVRVESATRATPIVAMNFVVMTVIPSSCCKAE